jgi:hypothetical protein
MKQKKKIVGSEYVRSVVTRAVSIFGMFSCDTLECKDTKQMKVMLKKSTRVKSL